MVIEVGKDQHWMWVARVLKRSDEYMRRRIPHLRDRELQEDPLGGNQIGGLEPCYWLRFTSSAAVTTAAAPLSNAVDVAAHDFPG